MAGWPQTMQTAESLVTLVGEGHEVGDGAEGLVGEGGVEAGEEDALAEGDELKGKRDDGFVEELGFVDADDIDVGELGVEVLAESGGGGDGGGVVGLGLWLAMAVRW